MCGFELESHPGDAVLIAPVSVRISCHQGILQGISQFQDPKTRISDQNTAVLQRFLGQFPTKLNRENIFENREVKNQKQGIKLQKQITRIWLSQTSKFAIGSRPRSHEMALIT